MTSLFFAGFPQCIETVPPQSKQEFRDHMVNSKDSLSMCFANSFVSLTHTSCCLSILFKIAIKKNYAATPHRVIALHQHQPHHHSL